MLQGGNDVAPESLRRAAAAAPNGPATRVRDRYEMELIGAFIQAGKPVFGVCRGLQLLNVMHGGTLYQDIPTPAPRFAATHRDSCSTTSSTSTTSTS